LNFLLPLLVGGPDMAKQIGPPVRKYRYDSKVKKIGIRQYSTNSKANVDKDVNKNEDNKDKKSIKSRIFVGLKQS
jgi:hypothetical protein